LIFNRLQINEKFKWLPRFLVMGLIIGCFFIHPTYGQDRPPGVLLPDSLKMRPASPEILPTGAIVKISKDSIEETIEYFGKDSSYMDARGQKVYLFGDAYVNYGSIELKADYIEFDMESNIVFAKGLPDSSGTVVGKPEFKEGDQQFTAEEIRYNFETGKAYINKVISKQNDIYILGERTKLITTKGTDGSAGEDVLYSQGSIFTTCDHPEPHFGILSTKQKIIPNKMVIVGPSNLRIMDVPTPLWLPFGFFPISQGKRTGLLFPRDYEYSDQWGFGLRDIGWYFPLGDHFNFALRGNIYLKGTWGINGSSQYRKRYKYSGNVQLGFDNRRTENNDGTISRQKSFSFTWSHRQENGAHPTNRFGGSINIQTNGYQQRVFNDASRVLENQLNSNFSFQKNWSDLPISLSVGLNHNQNNATGNMTINFPNIQFQTQALYPFKNKNGGSNQEKWYESVVVRYSGETRTRIQGKDTTIFNNFSQTLKDAEFGAKHDVTLGTSFKVLKYFNLNPNASYKEVWYLRSQDRQFYDQITTDTLFNDQGEFYIDTTGYGYIEKVTKNGFVSYRQFNAALSLNTQIFGTVQFKKGVLRGLRHVVKPAISMVYAPNYLDPGLGYYQYLPDPNDPDELDRYGVFEGGMYGAPPASDQQMAISYSINNIFEAKYFSKKDSADKKLKLFNNIIVNGNYNFAADSLKWSPVNVSGTTRLFKGMSTLSARAQWDPYTIDENGRRVDQLQWRQNGKVLRFVNAAVNINSNLTVSKIRDWIQGKEDEVVLDVRNNPTNAGVTDLTDFWSLFDNFSIRHNLNMSLTGLADGSDTFRITTNSINIVGNINLTDNWTINVGNFGYDFARKGFSYPSVSFSRDLHCWDMGMSWQPTRGTYSFFLRVKPGSLDFIKIPYNKNNADGIGSFGGY
jgi:hypothetical protein